MSEYLRAALDLAKVPDRVPSELRKALKDGADRIVLEAFPAVASGGSRSPAWYGLRYRGPYDASGDRVAVQFHPTFVARYKEGGAKTHVIDPSAAGTKKNLSFQRRKFKSAFKAQQKAASAKTAKSRDRWDAKGASALDEAASAQRGEVALGVLAIGRGKGKNRVDVSPAAKPNSNFTRRVKHPGIPATKPLARAIRSEDDEVADNIRRRVNRAWETR